MMQGKPGPGGARFAFVDAGEAARRLDIDRLTLEQWTRDGRLRQPRFLGLRDDKAAREVVRE